MKQTNEKVYRCDFCNRAILQKGSMTLHERQCKRNHKNMHKCFQYCTHLVKWSTAIYVGDDYENTGTCFQCALKPDIDLYSYKLERTELGRRRIGNMTRMPLQCSDYEVEGCHEENYPECLYK